MQKLLHVGGSFFTRIRLRTDNGNPVSLNYLLSVIILNHIGI